HTQPRKRLPVGVDIAEVAPGLPLQLVVVERIERIVEPAAGRECDRSRVWEAPRAMQVGWTAQELLRVEVRWLPQRADADPVYGIAAIGAAVLRLHHLHTRIDDEVLEQRVRARKPRRV